MGYQNIFLRKRFSFPFVILMAISALCLANAGTPNIDLSEDSGWYQEAVNKIREEEYEVTWQEKCVLPDGKPAYHMTNRAQDLRLYFSSEGVSVIRRTGPQSSWILGWSLDFDQSGKASPSSKPDMITNKNRIEYRRNGILEQYENLEKGVKQTIVIKENIKDITPLIIKITLTGNMTPTLEEGDNDIEFVYDNKTEVGFKDLQAKDAQGNYLSLQIMLEENQLIMIIDDQNAIYPIQIGSLFASLPPWSMESNLAEAQFGYSVCTAGDVNGDGYSDIIIGAPTYDNGEEKEGKAFVYHGSATGPGATSNFSYESNQVYAELGCAVSTAGDLNDDGYSDVVIGAKYYADGENDEGLIFIFKGSASGLYFSHTQGNNDEGAHYGSSVAPIGDFDGDGYSDIIVGSPDRDSSKGAVFIYYGSEFGYFSRASAIFSGGTSKMGCSVCTAGDVDRDGYADIIFGAYTYSNEQSEEGQVAVYFGKDSGIKGTWYYEYNLSSIHLGASVSTAGDVNGDGYSDIIVGAPDYTNTEANEGMVLIFYGTTAGLGTTPDLKIESNKQGAKFGSSVALAGDWDGDGYADVIVGAPGYKSDDDHVDEGAIYIYRGSSSGLINTPDWFEKSGQAGARFGASVSTAGDVNGDGYSDILVGAPAYDSGETDEGKCFLYYGKPKPPTNTPDWYTQNATPDCDFAVTVAGAGDVNGDGFADIMIGAPYYDNGQTNEGRVFIHHGRSHNVPDTNPTVYLEPNFANAYFGSSFASAGDVNDDGYDDIIIGAYGYDSKGRVWVYYGSGTGISSGSNTPIIAGYSNAQLGFSVSGAGDVNGDGYADIIMGSPGYPDGNSNGIVHVFWGTASGITGSNQWAKMGDQAGATFGNCVSSAGDVNGDGYSDVMIGAPGYANGQTSEGRTYVFYGSHSGVKSDTPWIAESNQEYSLFGQSVSSAGDMNGDGYSDVIISAPFYDNEYTNEGAAFIYLGWHTGLFASPLRMLDGANQNDALFGFSLSAAGDVNGDGFADVIVGAFLRNNINLIISTSPSLIPPLPTHDNAGSAYIYLGSPTGPSTAADWSEYYHQTDGYFGRCVAGAGDVNGDGFADVIIGAPGYSSADVKYGRAYLYLGGGGNGRLVKPNQSFGSNRTARLGKSNNNQFSIGFNETSIFGRGKLEPEWETKALGMPLDGTNTFYFNSYHDIGAGVINHTYTSGTYKENTLIHWRARMRYDPVTFPYQSHGPWITIPWNGTQEADLRTGPSSDPSLQEIINYILGRSHYPHDINIDGINDAADVIDFLIP